MKHALLLLCAAACAAAAPRETVSLDGTWQIVFDRRNEGRPAKWHVQKTFESLPGRRAIPVPSCWETLEQDYEGAAWYGRRVRVPAGWKDKAVRLRFGAVNYRAEVWVNDQPAGFHEGGYTPFELSVADLLRPGQENFIAVRVLGPVLTKDTYLDNIGPNETPHWRGAIAGGMWQSVEMIASEPVYVADIFVQPDIERGRAVVRARIENAGVQNRVAGASFEAGGVVIQRQLTLRPGKNEVDAELTIPHARLWSPDDPHLYTAHVKLTAGGAVLDSEERRFGMREFAVRGQSYYLNGRKIYLKAGFWEGFYPRTLAFPPDAEMVRREIRLAKEAGFNVLRPWRKPPAPVILDLADELGIMVIGAPPVECMNYWPQLAPETEERIAAEVREMVRRDRNHASVIYWELFNEIARPGLQRLKHGMSLLARELDPTRMVIDESGGWAGGANAYPPRGYEPVAMNELHSYQRAPVEPRIYDFYLHLGQPGFDSALLGRHPMRAPDGLIFVSEVGYGGLPDLPGNVERYRREGNPLTPDYRSHVNLLASIENAMREMRWSDLFPDTAALCRASQRVQAEGNELELEALRLNPRVAGYCVHAYTDGDWVLGAGLLDLFREPKLTYHSIAKVQAPLYLAIRVNPGNVREDGAARLRIDAVNEREPVRGRLEWEIAAPGGGVVKSAAVDATAGSGISGLLDTQITPLGASGAYTVRARLGDLRNEREFFYIGKKDLAPPAAEIALLDPKNEVAPLLKFRAVRFRAFDAAGNVPVLVSGAAPAEAVGRVMSFVRGGGTAMFLKLPPALLRALPFDLKTQPARGNWIPVNHGIRPHAIFEGLPSGDFMGQVYQNVCAAETLAGSKEPPVVGSLSLENDNHTIDRNYLGLNRAWWGSDMAVIPYGKGRVLLSTLRILENLDADPVAEKLLYNILRWSTTR